MFTSSQGLQKYNLMVQDPKSQRIKGLEVYRNLKHEKNNQVGDK